MEIFDTEQQNTAGRSRERGVVAPSYNPSIQEVKTGKSHVRGHPRIYSTTPLKKIKRVEYLNTDWLFCIIIIIFIFKHKIVVAIILSLSVGDT